MYWNDGKEDDTSFKIPDDIVDLSFAINCKCLPLDHAYALSQALQDALPWLGDDAASGMHLIHVAESGNGWFRPQETENALLQLSRRTRMMLRVPKERIDKARALEGTVMDVAGHSLTVGQSVIKKLSVLSTLFARHVVMGDPNMSEDAFLEQVVTEMRELGFKRINKVLCGRAHDLHLPDSVVHTQSVMVADLEPEMSILLQQKGLGSHRKMGCGLFLPHKGIKAVKETH